MKKLLYKAAGLLLIVASIGGGWIYLEYRAFINSPLGFRGDDIVFHIAPGTGLSRVSRDLGREGVVKHPRFLAFYGRWNGLASRLKAGEYTVSAGLTPRQLLQQFVEGKVKTYSITLIEGWTFRQMMDEVGENGVLVKSDLDKMSREELMHKIGFAGMHPEGMFLPDTYQFPRGTTELQFLKRAAEDMRRFLNKAWAGRDKDLPLANPYEALILASIVERETGVASERKQIAGVFIRRLKKKMRLQTDPTVIYGMGERFRGNITRKDLRTDTPYNTYTRHGLPPTPIAMPSRAAIMAVMHPAPGKALYFVSRGDGSHQFSETLEQHNKAVIKYQLGGKKRPFSSYPAKKQK